MKHSYTNNKEEAIKYKGSKYCQSFIGDNYKKVGEFLNDGKKVLFIGTPCQIQGLNKYLEVKNTDKANLITVDLVCHGVPSQQYLTNYIQYLEKKYKRKATNVSFRDSEKYIFKLFLVSLIYLSFPFIKTTIFLLMRFKNMKECKHENFNFN